MSENFLPIANDSSSLLRKNSGGVLDLVDSAALLFRFELAGISVGDRWKEVADLWLPHVPNHITGFSLSTSQ